MTLNYIILGHKNPPQIKRLIERLSSTNTFFYVHIDKNFSLEPFYEELKGIQNITFINENERETGIWGDWGIVKGTLNTFSRIIKDNRDGYCILLSGQDYPLRSNEFIKQYFTAKADAVFLTAHALPNNFWATGGMNRITKYKINRSMIRGDFFLLPSIYSKDFYSKASLGKINFLRKRGRISEIFKIFRKRNFPDYIRPYGGAQWFAAPVKVIEEVLNFTSQHPEYLEYHRYTLLPDEIFFHSILMYLKEKKDFPLCPSLTHVNWSKKNRQLPLTYLMEDFSELIESSNDKLFARKFDSQLDSKIQGMIDKRLLREDF